MPSPANDQANDSSTGDDLLLAAIDNTWGTATDNSNCPAMDVVVKVS
jgi:hypothetical protein